MVWNISNSGLFSTFFNFLTFNFLHFFTFLDVHTWARRVSEGRNRVEVHRFRTWSAANYWFDREGKILVKMFFWLLCNPCWMMSVLFLMIFSSIIWFDNLVWFSQVVLYCNVLYCIVLYCIVLYCIAGDKGLLPWKLWKVPHTIRRLHLMKLNSSNV